MCAPELSVVCRSCGEDVPDDQPGHCRFCEDWDPRGENDGLSAAYLAAEHRDRDRI